MSNASTELGRLRRAKGRLRRKLAHGFARVVFATSKEDENPEVHESPGGALDDERFAEWFALAERATLAGRVKHTWIVDEVHRLEVDARHGFVKSKTRDAAQVEKAMGGKDRALRPDRSATFLREIGIMNPDGSIPAKRAKKYKQVNHFVELLRPTLGWLSTRRGADASAPLRVVDLACGNAYLSFVLAETLRLEARELDLLGVDLREDLIARARSRADALELEGLRFEVDRLETLGADALEDRELLLALHACDTATDEAIAAGVRAAIPALWVVPCCQAELAAQLAAQSEAASAARSTGPTSELPALLDDGLLRRSYADALTDALRVEVLRACGYEVAVVEFVASEHTPKNLLLRAHRKGDAPPFSAALLGALQRDMRARGLDPRLLRTLAPAGLETSENPI